MNYDELTLGHQVNFILGFGSDPSSAPHTVATLRRLVSPSSSVFFGQYVEGLVSRLAVMPPEMRAEIKEFWRRTKAEMILDPAEGRARIWQLGWEGDAIAVQNGVVDEPVIQEFHDPDKTGSLEDFLQGPNKGAVVWRRQPVELSLTVLTIAAELLAGTPQPVKSSAPEVGGTEAPQPKNEATSDLAGSEARFTISQLPNTAAGYSPSPDNSGRKGNFQPFLFGSWSPETFGDHSHGLCAG
ncbi:hypothetical protein D9599_25770 [Roseomonas sp. KE2513]|nr:hypothetical protein [Roseomonas sp. KE2513]